MGWAVLWLLTTLVGVALGQCPPLDVPEPMPAPAASDDRTPPLSPSIVAHEVDIVPGGVGAGCVGGDPACATRVVLEVTLETPDDDVTPADGLGYTFALVEGELPPGILLPDGAVRGPTVRMSWDVDAEALPDAIDVTVEIRSVDAAGNRSEGWSRLTVRSDAPAGAGGGCGHAALPLGAVLGLVLRRRRRAR